MSVTSSRLEDALERSLNADELRQMLSTSSYGPMKRKTFKVRLTEGVKAPFSSDRKISSKRSGERPAKGSLSSGGLTRVKGLDYANLQMGRKNAQRID